MKKMILIVMIALLLFLPIAIAETLQIKESDTRIKLKITSGSMRGLTIFLPKKAMNNYDSYRNMCVANHKVNWYDTKNKLLTLKDIGLGG